MATLNNHGYDVTKPMHVALEQKLRLAIHAHLMTSVD